MNYSDFLGNQVSKLGFGAMRLPIDTETNKVDEDQVYLMVDAAIAGGVNYFDTAYPYHNGMSEIILGNALKRYNRSEYFLADKFPGHQIAPSYNPEEIFEKQLKKCNTDYFDYYLLHNVCENSIDVYCDPKWGIVKYFQEQVKNGRIKHLGFSSHGRPDNLEFFLHKYKHIMEFVQIQLNYVDYHLQDAKDKVDIIHSYGKPIVVMEPLRGGKLARLDDYNEKLLKKLRPWDSTASWAFRWLDGIEDVKVVLSGMSNMKQLEDNLRTYNSDYPLVSSERNMLVDIADKLAWDVPCTNCGYCKEQCPKNLDIPRFMQSYNDITFTKNYTIGMQIDSLPDEEKPSACIGCNNCTRACPQKINVSGTVKKLDKILQESPSWAEESKKRLEAAKENN